MKVFTFYQTTQDGRSTLLHSGDTTNYFDMLYMRDCETELLQRAFITEHYEMLVKHPMCSPDTQFIFVHEQGAGDFGWVHKIDPRIKIFSQNGVCGLSEDAPIAKVRSWIIAVHNYLVDLDPSTYNTV